MSSKRNKLLIFLGLITIVTSKSYNQRFHHDFEPTKASARNFSANLHLADEVFNHNQSTTTNLQGQMSKLENDNDSNQTEKLDVMISEEDYGLNTKSEETDAQATQVQIHKTRRSKHNSSGKPDNTGAGKIYFEAQKIKGRKKAVNNTTEKGFVRRTGILIADTDVPDSTPKTPIETGEIIEEDKTSDNKDLIESEQTPNEGKNPVKKNKKRKKVLRVRVRNQTGDNTRRNSNKNESKPTQKTKTVVHDTKIRQKPNIKISTEVHTSEPENTARDSGIKLRFPGPPRKKIELLKPTINLNAEKEDRIEPPPMRENKLIINNNESENTSKSPDYIPQDELFHSNRNLKNKKKKKTSESRSEKNNKTLKNQGFQRTKSKSLEMPLHVQEKVFQSNRDFEAIRKETALQRSSSRNLLPKLKQTSIPAANQNYSETKHRYPQLQPEQEISGPNKNFNIFMNQGIEQARSKTVSDLNVAKNDSPTGVPAQKQVFQSNKNIDVLLKETVSKLNEKKNPHEPDNRNSSKNKFQMSDALVQNQNFRANENVTDSLSRVAVEVNPTRSTQTKFLHNTSEKKFELSESPKQTQVPKTNQDVHDITKNIPQQSRTTNGNESENKKAHSFFHTNKKIDLSKDKISSELDTARGIFRNFPDANQDNSRGMPKIPDYPLQEEISKPNSNFNKKEKRLLEQKSTNKHEPGDEERLMTFFRRTGQKTALKTNAEKSYPESDWKSKFMTENQNDEDNSYVVSFNYMGNSKGEDSVRLSPGSTEKRTESSQEYENQAKLKNSFSGGSLENTGGKLSKKPKQISGSLNNYKNQGEHFGTNENSRTLNGDPSSFSEDIYGSGELSVNDKSFQEKQYSPSVTLKRKKIKSSKEPVWKLQTKKKKDPNSEWKETKLGSIHDNPTKFDKPSVDGTDYYVRSFMKFPSGENVDINIKKEFPYDNFKEKAVPRKPLLPLENKGTGNYFIHMYKKMGSFENFDIKSSENPDNAGYLSSLKLSWTDDDRQARVEESVDSRAYNPTRGHSFSAENIRTRDYSRGDMMSFQPSENLMQYRPHYEDDFTASLKNDQSYYFQDIPIMLRRKRSSDNEPEIATHFKPGDFNVENKHTLENGEKAKTLENVKESVMINKPMPSASSPTVSDSRNVGTLQSIPKARRQHYIKSYYFKPSESRKVVLNATDIFSKYEEPSRDRSNIQIFHSYQTPNRDPQQPYDMTYFFRGEDKRTEIPLSDKISFRSMHSPESNSNSTALKNFQPASDRKKVDSTDVQESYMKPEKLTSYKSSNKTGTNFQTSPKKILMKKKGKTYVPILEIRTDKNITKPIFKAPWTTMTAAIIQPRLNQGESDTQTEVENRSHEVAEPPKSGNLAKKDIQSKINKDFSTSVPSVPQVIFQTGTKTVKLFKLDSGQNKMESQKSLDMQERRIDTDNSWLPPAQQDENYKEYEDATVRHFNENLQRKKQMKNRHHDGQPLTQNDNEQNLNTITSHAPFQWKDTPIEDQSSQEKYPTYHSIPKTHFKCKGQAPGYYADPETECQVFHMCHSNGVKHSFLCPNGTIFHQRLLVCDWYTKVHCDSAESFYGVNNMLYKYSPPIKKDYGDQGSRSYRQNQNVVISHSQPRTGNYDQSKQPALISTTSGSLHATYAPHLVNTHYKEGVHKSESENQMNDPGSFLPQSKRITNPTFMDQGGYYSSVHDDRTIHPLSLGNKASPHLSSDELQQINSKNNAKNQANAVKREQLTDSNRNHAYQNNNQGRNPPLNPQNSRNTEPKRNKKVIIPLVNSGNSYYVPNLNGLRYVDGDTHVAGRQNDKVIVINKYKLNPDYDSAESQESKYSKEPEIQDFPTKSTLPTPTVTHRPYNDAKQNRQILTLEPLIIQQQSLNQNENKKRNKINAMNEASKYFYENNSPETNQKSNPVNTRAPQYIYPLPGIIQNKDGSREYNYGYRVEDPKAVNLQKAQIIKLTSQPSQTESLLDGKSTMDSERERIKWRIAEIKSGIENIGAQVGKILSGTDSTFKNVRIFKMKPGSSSGELEEIRLTPFKSQRSQSPNTQSLNLEEQKVKLPDNHQQELRSPKKHYTESQSIKPRKPINEQEKLETLLNFKEKNSENDTINNGHNYHKQTWKTVPKYPQKDLKKDAPVRKPKKLSYNKNKEELRTYDQVVKVVTPDNFKPLSVQSYPKSTHENFKAKSQEDTPKLKHSIDHNKDRPYVPIPTKSTSEEEEKKEYKIKHVSQENYDKKQDLYYKNNMKSSPLYQHEKSEHFENTYVPKIIHEMDSSDIIYPDKIILRPKGVIIKTKPTNSEKNKFVDVTKNQKRKYNTKKIYKNYLVNSGSLKQELPTNLPDYNSEILHTTTVTPGNNKEMRTFAVLSKPTLTTERHSTNSKSGDDNNNNNNNQQDSIETSRSHHVTKLTHISNPERSKETDCDDSVSHDALAMELGKNGPTHDTIQGGSRKGAFIGPDSRSYRNLPDEITPKCHDSSDSSTPNQDKKNSESEETPRAQIKKPIFYNKPTSKIIFKELKRPKYTYGPDKITNFNVKTADESVQLKSKPVKLFQLQRNMRPAFMKPATAIPITAAISKTRNYYHPQEVVTNIKHQGHYNEKRELRPPVHNEERREPKPAMYYQERPERLVTAYKHDRRNLRPERHYVYGKGKQMKPAINQGTETLKTVRSSQERVVIHNANNKGERPHSYIQSKEPGDIQDDRSFTVISNDNHNKDLKYADLEKAAELLAMQKLQKNKQNPQTNTFPAVRTEPQGQTATQLHNVSSEQNNHTRHSRYAALEKEAELKAQRMFQTKNQTS